MDDSKLIRYTVQIEIDVRDEFKKICKQNGFKAGFMMNELMKEFIEKHSNEKSAQATK